VCVYVCACVYVCVRVCMCVCACVCVYKERNVFLTFTIVPETEQNIPSVCPFA